MRSSPTFVALAAAAALLPALAHPHDGPPVERIEVTGHYDNGVGTSDAASAGIVTSRLIENRPVLRPAEILEFVPGVVVTQHSGSGKANQYFLRGFNLDHGTDFATWVAGMPVNMRTHAHGQGYSDLNFLIPELVDRIEYFKGPYYAAEGDFASAGAAHIEIGNRLPQGIAEATWGERGYRRGLLAASPEIGAGTLLAALEVGRNDGPWQSPESLKKWSGVLRYSQGPRDNGWNVTAMGYESRWSATDQIPARSVASGALDRFGTVNPSDGGDTARYSLSFDLHRRGNAGTFEANAYAIRSRLDLFSDFTYFLDDPVHGDQFEQAERRTVLGGSARYRWAEHWGERDVTHSVGVQLRDDRIDPIGLYATVERMRIATKREDRVRESSAAVYYENVLRWSETFRTLAGLRYDRYRFGVANDTPGTSGQAASGIASPKLSAIFAPWGRGEIFANWGRGFHSNDARGRASPLVRSDGAELGFRAEPVTGLQSSVALWRLALDSELVFVGDAGTTEAGRPSRRHGIEWNNHYVASPKVLLDLDVSISRARFSDDDPAGNHIPGAAATVVSFGVALNDLGPWSGSFQLRHFGPRPLVEDDSVRSKATTLAYGRTAYRLNRDWRVSLDVFNLFDRKASDIDYLYASRLPGEPAGGVPDIHFHPVEPRAFRLTFTYRL